MSRQTHILQLRRDSHLIDYRFDIYTVKKKLLCFITFIKRCSSHMVKAQCSVHIINILQESKEVLYFLKCQTLKEERQGKAETCNKKPHKMQKTRLLFKPINQKFMLCLEQRLNELKIFKFVQHRGTKLQNFTLRKSSWLIALPSHVKSDMKLFTVWLDIFNENIFVPSNQLQYLL